MSAIDVHGVVIAGYPGSGKGEAVRVAEEAGYRTVSMGDCVREKAVEKHGEDILESETAVAQFATDSREEHGPEIVADWTLDSLSEQSIETTESVIIIGGVRSLDEIEHLSQSLTDLTVVYISAPIELRLHRIRDRGRNEEEKTATLKWLRNRDSREGSRWGTDRLVEQERYDEWVPNTGSLSEFETRIQLILDGFEE